MSARIQNHLWLICLPFCFSSLQTYSWWQRCNSTTQATERCADPRELSPRRVPGSSERCLPSARPLYCKDPATEASTEGMGHRVQAMEKQRMPDWGSRERSRGSRPPYVCMRPTRRAAVKIQVTKHEKQKTALKKVKCMSKRKVKIKKSDKTKDWWGYGAAGVTKTEIGKLTKRCPAWEDITNDFI